MKKISILSLHLGYGGIEKSIVALANLLAPNYKVEIVCIYKLYDKEAFKVDDNVKIKYLIRSNLPKKVEEYKLLFFKFHFIKLIKKLFKDYFLKLKFITFFKDAFGGISMYPRRAKVMKNYIKNSNADVIISSRTFLNEWLSNYAKDGVLTIGWEHNHYHNDMKYAIDVIRSCKNLDYFVLVSNDLYEFYSKKLIDYNCKCVYIPNVLDSFPDKCAPLVEKRLVSVGRLSKEKGYIDLLRLYNILVKEYPDWSLDIVGDGPEREKLEDYIKSHNLFDKVTLHGYQGREYIDKLLNKSSIYLMTSYTESFGIVLIEAMSHGLPCIAFSSAEGARELIDSGRTGYLIKNRNNRAYIQKVEDLINDIDARKRIGHESRKNVKKYNGEEVVKLWYDILEKK